MPLDADSLITTVGGSTSNSFVTLAEAEAFFNRKRTVIRAPWDDTEQGDRIAVLMEAADKLKEEKVNWLGSPVTETQALSWPRYGVPRIERASTGCSVYSTTEIPRQVKDAQCELALAYLNGAQSTGENNGTIKRWKADDVEIEYGQSPTGQPGTLAPNALELISGLIAGPQLARS